MPAVIMPPMSARGNARDGSMVSSATFAAFSNPVMAKKASETPASTASTADPGPPSTWNCSSTAGSPTPSTSAITPMATTMMRPLISTNVMITFATTDSLMPMRLMAVMTATNATAMPVVAQIADSGRPMRSLR